MVVRSKISFFHLIKSYTNMQSHRSFKYATNLVLLFNQRRQDPLKMPLACGILLLCFIDLASKVYMLKKFARLTLQVVTVLRPNVDYPDAARLPAVRYLSYWIPASSVSLDTEYCFVS